MLAKLFTPTFNKKRYFQEMLIDASKVIADLEFKKYTALNEREVTRRQYDQITEALSRAKDDDKKQLTKILEDTKKQIEAIDATIVGGAPSELLPDGAEGIDNKLKSWVSRREYIRGFIKHNC